MLGRLKEGALYNNGKDRKLEDQMEEARDQIWHKYDDGVDLKDGRLDALKFLMADMNYLIASGNSLNDDSVDEYLFITREAVCGNWLPMKQYITKEARMFAKEDGGDDTLGRSMTNLANSI